MVDGINDPLEKAKRESLQASLRRRADEITRERFEVRTEVSRQVLGDTFEPAPEASNQVTPQNITNDEASLVVSDLERAQTQALEQAGLGNEPRVTNLTNPRTGGRNIESLTPEQASREIKSFGDAEPEPFNDRLRRIIFDTANRVITSKPEDFTALGTRVNPKLEGLIAFEREGKVGVDESTVGLDIAGGTGRRRRKGAGPAARLNSIQTEKAFEKVNSLLEDPFGGDALDEAEFDSIKSQLLRTEAGSNFLRMRANAEKSAISDLDKNIGAFNTMDDVNNFIAKYDGNNLIKAFVAEEALDAVQSDDIQRKFALNQKALDKAQLGKMANDSDIRFNSIPWFTHMTTVQGMSGQSANKMIADAFAGDVVATTKLNDYKATHNHTIVTVDESTGRIKTSTKLVDKAVRAEQARFEAVEQIHGGRANLESEAVRTVYKSTNEVNDALLDANIPKNRAEVLDSFPPPEGITTAQIPAGVDLDNLVTQAVSRVQNDNISAREAIAQSTEELSSLGLDNSSQDYLLSVVAQRTMSQLQENFEAVDDIVFENEAQKSADFLATIPSKIETFDSEGKTGDGTFAAQIGYSRPKDGSVRSFLLGKGQPTDGVDYQPGGLRIATQRDYDFAISAINMIESENPDALLSQDIKEFYDLVDLTARRSNNARAVEAGKEAGDVSIDLKGVGFNPVAVDSVNQIALVEETDKDGNALPARPLYYAKENDQTLYFDTQKMKNTYINLESPADKSIFTSAVGKKDGVFGGNVAPKIVEYAETALSGQVSDIQRFFSADAYQKEIRPTLDTAVEAWQLINASADQEIDDNLRTATLLPEIYRSAMDKPAIDALSKFQGSRSSGGGDPKDYAFALGRAHQQLRNNKKIEYRSGELQSTNLMTNIAKIINPDVFQRITSPFAETLGSRESYVSSLDKTIRAELDAMSPQDELDFANSNAGKFISELNTQKDFMKKQVEFMNKTLKENGSQGFSQIQQEDVRVINNLIKTLKAKLFIPEEISLIKDGSRSSSVL